MDLRRSPQAVSMSGRCANPLPDAASLRTRSRRSRRLQVHAALKEKEGLAVAYKQGQDEVLVRVPVGADIHKGDVQWEVHPSRLRLAVRSEVLLEGDFGGHRVELDGCFWCIEEDGGQRFVEVTIEKAAPEEWRNILESDPSASAAAKVTTYVFMDLEEDGKAIGRVTLGLFGDAAPRTVENFRALSTGEKGTTEDGARLHYKGSNFHRIIPGFMIQGGDMTHGDGTGGASIYGDSFDDENFDVAHDARFLLSMANAGPNANGSQFFITLNQTPHLDGKHTVFGKAVGGYNIVSRVAHAGSPSGKPASKIVIADCGELDAADVTAEELEDRLLGVPAGGSS